MSDGKNRNLEAMHFGSTGVDSKITQGCRRQASRARDGKSCQMRGLLDISPYWQLHERLTYFKGKHDCLPHTIGMPVGLGD